MKKDGTVQSNINMLHMPMKLNQQIVDKFKCDGRKLPNGEDFSVNKIYIPKSVYDQAKDLVALLEYTVAIEYNINAEKLLYEDLLMVTMR